MGRNSICGRTARGPLHSSTLIGRPAWRGSSAVALCAGFTMRRLFVICIPRGIGPASLSTAGETRRIRKNPRSSWSIRWRNRDFERRALDTTRRRQPSQHADAICRLKPMTENINHFAKQLLETNWCPSAIPEIMRRGAEEIKNLERILIEIAKSRDDDLPRLVEFRDWIRRKLRLAPEATDHDIYGQMNVTCSHSFGYETYIVAHKCDDKQGEIARLNATLDSIRQKLQEIVCTEGCDRGVVMLSQDGPTHYDAEAKCQVYDHENFSPLGDALIELYDMVVPMKCPKDTNGDGDCEECHRYGGCTMKSGTSQ